MNNKTYKILRYMIESLLIFIWFVMMFFSDYATTLNFRIFVSITIGCAMIYSFCRKKYFPTQQTSKIEKIVALIYIVSLFCKILLF